MFCGKYNINDVVEELRTGRVNVELKVNDIPFDRFMFRLREAGNVNNGIDETMLTEIEAKIAFQLTRVIARAALDHWDFTFSEVLSDVVGETCVFCGHDPLDCGGCSRGMAPDDEGRDRHREAVLNRVYEMMDKLERR